ncbi:MAG: type II and III secretion system protein family protein [Bauldia sp.]
MAVFFARTLGLATFAAALLVGGPQALAQSSASCANNVQVAAGRSALRCSIGLNRSVVLDLPRDARDVLVSNPEIADAVVRTSRRIYLTGLKIGEANVFVFDAAGGTILALDLEVAGQPSGNLQALLARLIPGSRIEVSPVQKGVVLSGTVKSAADARSAVKIAETFVNGGTNAGAVSSAAIQGLTQGGTVSSTTQTTATGAAATSGQSGGAVASASANQVVNMLAIEGEEQVHLKVTVAEIQRNTAKQFGLNLNGRTSIGGLVTSIVTDNPFAVAGKAISPGAISGTGGAANAGTLGGNGLTSRLQALEQTGMVRTLAEPTLTAISGESANFLAGGEFPVPTGIDKEGNVAIQFKPYGVGLSFSPVVLSAGRISLHVKTEVSELSQDGAFQLGGGGGLTIPGLKVRRTETTMELPSGGSLVMGGLLQDGIRQAITGLPGLKDLPVLGTLFRSRDFQRNETELVVIVTPYLVSPVATAALSRPDDGFSTAGDAAGIFLGRINRMYGVKGQAPPKGGYQGTFGFTYE